MGLGVKQPSEYSLQKMGESKPCLSSLKQLKKQHKATGPGTHIIICMNSDSNFSKQVPVDFKKFQSV